ncbi:hypothetical protein OOZ19_08030 [Saccharopolyspora sp. NFXS83]|nr:hypothetical protein [Saccharopolyspora sp. NFXS83]MCX2730187.1 hypothetical protein [Saccharopolyspora sp. NFXS83]
MLEVPREPFDGFGRAQRAGTEHFLGQSHRVRAAFDGDVFRVDQLGVAVAALVEQPGRVVDDLTGRHVVGLDLSHALLNGFVP